MCFTLKTIQAIQPKLTSTLRSKESAIFNPQTIHTALLLSLEIKKLNSLSRFLPYNSHLTSVVLSTSPSTHNNLLIMIIILYDNTIKLCSGTFYVVQFFIIIMVQVYKELVITPSV